MSDNEVLRVQLDRAKEDIVKMEQRYDHICSLLDQLKSELTELKTRVVIYGAIAMFFATIASNVLIKYWLK